MSAHVVCGSGLHVRTTGVISSNVIGIKKSERCARQRMPERFWPVAYADSEVGDVPVGSDRPSTSNLEYNPLRGGESGGRGTVGAAGQSELTEGL